MSYIDAIASVDAILANGHLTSDTKATIVDQLNTNLLTIADQTSAKFRAINELKVRVIRAPTVNLKLRRANLENANLHEKLTLSYKALINNTELDGIDVSTLTDPSDIASITYLKAVKAAALADPAVTGSSKSVTGALVDTTGISSILSGAVITDNDCHKPNDIPMSTISFMNMNG